MGIIIGILIRDGRTDGRTDTSIVNSGVTSALLGHNDQMDMMDSMAHTTTAFITK